VLDRRSAGAFKTVRKPLDRNRFQTDMFVGQLFRSINLPKPQRVWQYRMSSGIVEP
jgi:hypothetical protein